MSHATATSVSTFGVLDIGQSHVALPAEFLQEVVRLPEALTPAPMAPAFALGAFMLREELVPVIDLSRLLKRDDSQGTRPIGDQVAIVAWQGSHFGLRVDAIHGIAHIQHDELQQLNSGQQTPHALTPAAFTDPASGKPVYVLDIEALLALEGMTLARSSRHDVPVDAGESSSHRGNTRRALLVDCGGIRLSLPAGMVREIQPLETLSPPVMAVEGFMGTTQLRRQTLPVFRPLILAGLEDQSTPDGQLIVVIAACGQPLALCINHIIRMMDYHPDDVMALAEIHERAQATITGMIQHAQLGESLLVDETRFAHDADTLTLAGMYIGQETLQHREEEVLYRRFAFVHFDAFGHYATPLEQLNEVIPMPETFTPSTNAEEGWVGTIPHRDRSVSLIDLRALLGTPHDTPATDILLVACDRYLVGFMIDSARHIEYINAPADSLVVRWRGEQEMDTPPIEQCKRLIVVGTGAHKRILSVLCLETLAAMLINDDASRQCSLIDAVHDDGLSCPAAVLAPS